MQLRALRPLQGLVEHVIGLPVEVVFRHGQDRFLAAVWIGHVVDPPLAANVRVRQHAPQRDVLPDGHLGVNAMIAGAGRDAQRAVRQRRPAQLRLRCGPCVLDGDSRAICCCLAVRRVMHLEHEGRPRRDLHGGAVLVDAEELAGSEAAD